MLKNRYFISYLSTTLLYVLVAGLFFYTEKYYFVSTEQTKEKALKISLDNFVQEVIEPIEEMVEEIIEPIIEKKEPIEPEHLVEPEVIEEIIPEKIIPKPIIQKKVKIVKKKPKKKVKKKTVKKQRQQKPSSQKTKSTQAQINRFWKRLRVKIDKHKSYPRMAKKRRIEGTVKARFTILRSGNVGNISLSGLKIFYPSARAAIKKSFPLNTKKSPVSLPATINISLHYKIR